MRTGERKELRKTERKRDETGRATGAEAEKKRKLREGKNKKRKN